MSKTNSTRKYKKRYRSSNRF